MNAQEIIAELPKLDPTGLKLVQEKLAELQSVIEVSGPCTGWGRTLLQIVGTVNDLPSDLAINHDHYLYGGTKRPK